MNKLKYIGLILILLILPSYKTKAQVLNSSNANFCKYTLTDSYNSEKVDFLVLPYIEFGGNYQGAKEDTVVIDGFGVAGFELSSNKYNYFIESVSIPNADMSFAADFLFNKLITLDSKKNVTRCPDICYTINNNTILFIPKGTVNISANATFTIDNSSKCPGPIDYFSNLDSKASGTIQNNHHSGESNNEPTENKGSTCNGMISTEALNLIRRIMNYIQFLVPVLLLVMISVDFMTATIAKDDKKMKESYSKAVKRTIAGICVIIMPVFVIILFNIPVIKETLESTGIVDDPMCNNATGANILKIKVEISPKQFTKNSVKIKLTNTMGEYHHVTIKGTVLNTSYNSENRQVAEYEVSNNGEYEFEFYDSNSEVILTKKVKIENISKKMPGGSCIFKENSIAASAVAESGIESYSYKINDGEYTKPAFISTYQSNTKIKSASVKIKDKLDNVVEIKCEKEDEKVTSSGNLEVYFINVSWGDSIVIRSASKVIVIDGGMPGYANTTINFIKALGIKKIDAYIASHYDEDHIGATNPIYKAFPVTKAYVPSPKIAPNARKLLDSLKTNSTQMKMGDKIEFDKEFYIEVVGPPTLSQDCKKGLYCANMDSTNFLLHHGDITFFFTGDYVHSEALLKKYPKSTFKADVLKQPHHGMHNYISKEMLKAVSPKYIIMTSNSDIRKDETIKWHKESGAKEIHWTGSGKSGNMVFISDGKKLEFHKKINAKDYKR